MRRSIFYFSALLMATTHMSMPVSGQTKSPATTQAVAQNDEALETLIQNHIKKGRAKKIQSGIGALLEDPSFKALPLASKTKIVTVLLPQYIAKIDPKMSSYKGITTALKSAEASLKKSASHPVQAKQNTAPKESGGIVGIAADPKSIKRETTAQVAKAASPALLAAPATSSVARPTTPPIGTPVTPPAADPKAKTSTPPAPPPAPPPPAVPDVTGYPAGPLLLTVNPEGVQREIIAKVIKGGMERALNNLEVTDKAKEKILRYDKNIGVQEAKILDETKSFKERVKAFLTLDTLKVIISDEQKASALDGEYAAMLLNGGASQKLKKENKAIERHNSEIVTSGAPAGPTPRKTQADYVIFRDKGINAILSSEKAKPIATFLQLERAKYAKLSHEALAAHTVSAKEVHEATIAHIRHLRDHATDPAHQQIARDMQALHRSIRDTLAFNINDSHKKDSAAHEADVRGHLVQVNQHIGLLNNMHATHLASVPPGHPLHPLAQQHEHLLNALTAHKELVQHHVNNHVKHMPPSS